MSVIAVIEFAAADFFEEIVAANRKLNSINTRVVKNRDRRRRNRPPTASGY